MIVPMLAFSIPVKTRTKRREKKKTKRKTTTQSFAYLSTLTRVQQIFVVFSLTMRNFQFFYLPVVIERSVEERDRYRRIKEKDKQNIQIIMHK